MNAGKPRFPLARPSIGDDEVAAAVRVLRSGALVQGAEVARLEDAFRTLTGSAEAVAVANGTVAIELALRALGVGPGDEVIVPAFSFIATANAVENRGATPVFVDIKPDTFNIDPALAAAAVTPRTRVLLPVHEFGLCCDVDALTAIGARHNLVLVEDAACAIGSLVKGRHAGSFGLMGTFSLHPRKIVTCGEGGVVITQDLALAEKLRCLRNHGIAPGSQPASFVEAGTNARLRDLPERRAAVRGGLPELADLSPAACTRPRSRSGDLAAGLRWDRLQFRRPVHARSAVLQEQIRIGRGPALSQRLERLATGTGPPHVRRAHPRRRLPDRPGNQRSLLTL